MNTTPSAAAPVARRRSPVRSTLVTAAVLALAVVLALVGTGTSYALWNGRADVNASAVTAGSTGLTINGSQAFALTGMDVTKLGPGQSVVTSAPLTIANTGTTKLATTVVSTTVTGNAALAGELTVTLTPAGACSIGQAGGFAAKMPVFTTSSTPLVLQPAGQPGSTTTVCIQVTMDLDAPVNVKNVSTTFRLNLDGTQVR